MDELKADVVATTDPEIAKCLKVKSLIENPLEENRKDSEGNEESLHTITTSEMLDNHPRVSLSSSCGFRCSQTADSSSESSDHTSTDDILSRNSSVEHHCDDSEAMDCSTSPCSDHSDAESD